MPLEELERLCAESQQQMTKLRTTITLDDNTLELYNAGMMRGKIRFGLFARDQLTAALMLQDAAFLREPIKFTLMALGKGYDPLTGEEPGRALHEFDDVEIRGLKTRYNAAETSQLLLIAAAEYLAISGDVGFFQGHKERLESTTDYLLSHVREGLFWEDPSICGASRYALRATYWKDSHLPGRLDPDYPLVYTLVQAQTVAGLRAAAELAETLALDFSAVRLEERATGMAESLFKELWDEDLGYPLIAKDGGGRISGVSSDGLHLLAYLRQEDVPSEKLQSICAASRSLETPYGFRTYAPGQPDYSPKSYHLGAVWPFEQFFIAKGAIIHGQKRLLEVCLRVLKALERLGFPELLYADERGQLAGPGAILGEGCDLQLWSAAYPQAVYRLLQDVGGVPSVVLERPKAEGYNFPDQSREGGLDGREDR